jgi:hypothetical protein
MESQTVLDGKGVVECGWRRKYIGNGVADDVVEDEAV